MRDDPKPACLVLGDGVTVLGVIRSLHRARIPAFVAGNSGDVSSWSRWHRPAPVSEAPEPSASALARWLERVPLDSAVLMPCSDTWTQVVSELEQPEQIGFHRWNPGPEVVAALIDKDRFRTQLESLKLPHPRTFALDSPDQLQLIPGDVFSHAFLKPHQSQKFYARYGVKGIFVKSREEARQRLESLNAEGLQVVLQEYVPGDASSHYFVDGFRPKDQGSTRFLARQRLRMYPPDFGNSTDTVTAPLDNVAGAIDTLESLFGSLGYHGIFSAEFKQDQRDGEFKILEVNCRPWWYVDYADRCGLHACTYAYQDSLGLPLEDYPAYKLNKRCVYPMFDWAARQHNLASGVDEQGIVSMLKNWATGYQPIFSWTDPWPVIRTFFSQLKGAIARRIR